MIIKKISIAAFGGLKNKCIEPKNGFNVIYGGNEYGKTTVMSFIKMMFYGNERGSSRLDKNPRKKYTPWSGEHMAGSIDFEHGGRSYRLEREFRASNSTDKITLTDMTDGTRESVSGEVGSRFFGISAAAFERCLFTGQFGKAEGDAAAESEINSKLSNMVTTGDETVSYETVSTRLQKARLALCSKSGRAGECDKNKLRLSQLRTELEKTELSHKKHSEYKRNAEAVLKALEKAAARAAELKVKIENEADIRNAGKLRELLDLKTRLDAFGEELRLSDGSVADGVYTAKLKYCLSRLERIDGRIADKRDEIRRLSESFAAEEGGTAAVENEKAAEARLAALNAELASIEEELEKIGTGTVPHSSKGKSAFAVILIVSAVFALAGAAAAAIFKIAFFAVGLGVVSVAAAITAFVLLHGSISEKKFIVAEQRRTEEKNEALKTRYTALTREINLATVRLEAMRAAMGVGAALDGRKKLLEDAENAAEVLRQERETTEAELLGLFGRYRQVTSVDEVKSQLELLEKKAEELKQLKQRLNYLVRDLGNISYDEARLKLEAVTERAEAEDFEALKAEYAALSEELAKKRNALTAAETEDRILMKSLPDPAALKAEIASLEEKIGLQECFCTAADTALEVLQNSFAELRGSYGSALEKRAGEIFSELTGGAYGSVLISKTFDICVESKNEFVSREAEYLSSGAADQAYLSLRLALSSLIFDRVGQMPVFLDDSLAQYDDERMTTAVKFLQKYSEHGQVIMFTCHRAVLDAAEEAGAYAL